MNRPTTTSPKYTVETDIDNPALDIEREALCQRVLELAPEALQFLVDLMHGCIKDYHGDRIPVDDLNLRRLAAQDILDLFARLLTPPPGTRTRPDSVKLFIEKGVWDDFLDNIVQHTSRGLPS